MRFYRYCVQSVVVKWKYDGFEYHEMNKNLVLFSLPHFIAAFIFFIVIIFYFCFSKKTVFGLCRFEVRIEAMVLREEIFPLCAVMSREIDVVRVATKGKRTHTYTHTHARSGW